MASRKSSASFLRRNCFVFWALRVLAPPRPVVPVLSSIDACHGPLRSPCYTYCSTSWSPRSVAKQSSKSPQVLKKSSEFEDCCGN